MTGRSTLPEFEAVVADVWKTVTAEVARLGRVSPRRPSRVDAPRHRGIPLAGQGDQVCRIFRYQAGEDAGTDGRPCVES
ncbi:MAG TPA: hypothetical protein VMD08_03765 [Candidatus Baltobacteraceae bacterium]|nr:hypothetical protein [Candidatus Baltobacteraceae bacterium]